MLAPPLLLLLRLIIISITWDNYTNWQLEWCSPQIILARWNNYLGNWHYFVKKNKNKSNNNSNKHLQNLKIADRNRLNCNKWNRALHLNMFQLTSPYWPVDHSNEQKRTDLLLFKFIGSTQIYKNGWCTLYQDINL